MTQIDGLLHSKATVCSKKSVNLRDKNRRFTLLNSQNPKTTIHTLPSRHRNNQIAKGLKTTILPCKHFRLRINTTFNFFNHALGSAAFTMRSD